MKTLRNTLQPQKNWWSSLWTAAETKSVGDIYWVISEENPHNKSITVQYFTDDNHLLCQETIFGVMNGMISDTLRLQLQRTCAKLRR